MSEHTAMADSSEALIEASATRLFADHVNRDTIAQAEAGVFPQALWQEIQRSGFALATVPEAAGGLGLGWGAVFSVLHPLGASSAPAPLAETMAANFLLASGGVDVSDEPKTLIDSVLTMDASGTVYGHAPKVSWARHCQHAVALLQDGRLALLRLKPSPQTVLTPAQDMAGLPCDQISFTGATPAAVFDNPWPQWRQPVRSLGAMQRSAMMVGALAKLLEQTVMYANDRVQFGKPIGRYQAIQQQLALMAGDLAAARMAALVAAMDTPWAGNNNTHATNFSTAVAKVRAGEAATRGAAIAHQVHGAIGFTQEHSVQLSTRRLWAWREQFGSDAWWAQQLGQAAIHSMAQGQNNFWPAITSKHFARAPHSGNLL